MFGWPRATWHQHRSEFTAQRLCDGPRYQLPKPLSPRQVLARVIRSTPTGAIISCRANAATLQAGNAKVISLSQAAYSTPRNAAASPEVIGVVTASGT